MKKSGRRFRRGSHKKVGPVLAVSLIAAVSQSLVFHKPVWALDKLPRPAKVVEKIHSLDCDVQVRFNRLVDAYFNYLFQIRPSWATQVGEHQYDGLLEDNSPDALDKYRVRLKKFRLLFSDKSFADSRALPLGSRLDCRMVLNHIDGQIFEIDEMHGLERDPDRYSSHLADSVFNLAKRNFAPQQVRLLSAIERMEKGPAYLKQGEANLKPSLVPKMFAQVALEQLPGTIELFEKTIPDAFKDALKSSSPEVRKRFQAADARLIAALKEYQSFVKETILPHATGQFAIGAERYAKKLRFDEMEEAKLPLLLKRGYEELRRLQDKFNKLASEINPEVAPLQCFTAISSDHPPARNLVPATSSVLERIAAFIETRDILTIPSKDRVTVAESPSFLRALTFASMDTPGPFETKAKEAFYYVTPAESSWPKERIEEHMRTFSYPDLVNTSVHEAYPGHYVQFLWVNKAPSKVRKLIGCSSNDEGWAHYCEEMMVEEGLPPKDESYYKEHPEAEALDRKKLAMVQVHDALLRVCRYIVGIEMHTNGWSYEKGRDFFIKEGYMEKANAEREAKRGTSDPTYLVYTLGKLEILRMRSEFAAKQGSQYTLKDFHNRFLKCGFPPLPVVRAEIFGEGKVETK